MTVTQIDAAKQLKDLIFTRGGTVLNPTGPLNVVVWQAPVACTVTSVRGLVSGATGSSINARKNGSLTHLASNLTLTALDTWQDGGAVQNVDYAAGDELEIMITGVSGIVTQIAIQVNYTRP